MQKSRNITLLIMGALLICFYINQTMLSDMGNMYAYVINPLMHIGIVILFKILISSPYTTNRFKKETIQYVLITMLIYAIVYLTLGLLTGYGQNPYSTSLRGIAINLFVHASAFCSIEYIRYKLIHNVYKKDLSFIFVLIVILFSIIDSGVFEFFTNPFTAYSIFKMFFYRFLPSVFKNILFTYMALKVNCLPAIIYELMYYLILWLPPILPKAPWILESMLNMIFPLLLLLYVKYSISKKDRFELSRANEEQKPSSFVPVCILMVVLIWFALGVFPIKPVGIMTASMYPEIKIGDAVIIKKCTANDIKVKDVIEYQMDSYTVIHRVIEIRQEDGEFFFITKGDNNKDPDYIPVREDQLIGKAIYKVPYIALPAVWLHSIGGNSDNVQVELGD